MGMVVRTNTMAMNANRQLGMNNTQVAKSLEKLSSGFKINRAADDASGLAISEKMKAQIKGLDQASANSQDGISLIQTAEGAATEIHDMLNRMVELATKSANGTIQDDVDREAIQREVDDLNSEISRIAQSTNFNGINLLDGTLSSGSTSDLGDSVPFKLSGAQTSGLAVTQANARVQTNTAPATAGKVTAGQAFNYEITYTDKSGKTQTAKISLTANSATEVQAADGSKYTISDGATAAEQATILKGELAKNKDLNEAFDISVANTGVITFTAKDKGSKGAEVLKMTQTSHTTSQTIAVATTANTGIDKSFGIAYGAVANNKVAAYDGTGSVEDHIFEVGGEKFAFVTAGNETAMPEGVNYVVATAATVVQADATKMATLISQKTGISGITADAAGIQFGPATKSSGGGLTLQVGDTSDSFNKVTVSVDNLSAKGIGTEGLDVSNQTAAGNAIQTIKDAINQVSTNRANLGSLQNRLEHTINNLDTTSENMSAANSRIRDTDMAKEMMNYTKMNVLVQSAQAMLAQANQQPQSILQLLQ